MVLEETKVPDVTNWVGAIDRDIGVAFRYATNLATTCVPSGQALWRSRVHFKA